MGESTSKAGHRLLPAIVGAVIGGVLVGAPLAYKALGLREQLEATTRAADQAALDAHNKLVAVQTQLMAVQGELDSARTTAASTAHELKQQRELSAELAKPDIPLELSVRKALLDSGYVLVIRNPTPDDVAVAATIQSVDGHKMERRLVVDANYATEIGQSQGWAFASKDVITLTMAGHRDLIYMLPLY